MQVSNYVVVSILWFAAVYAMDLIIVLNYNHFALFRHGYAKFLKELNVKPLACRLLLTLILRRSLIVNKLLEEGESVLERLLISLVLIRHVYFASV